ncbi:MAG: DsbA family protein [Chloroflexi bacterium]|nr:DsbA family protein [Chloroflexota bacterium]
MTTATKLDFYFDVLCPFAWRTSLWIRQVTGQQPLTIRWKQLSLALVNGQAEESPFFQRDLALGRTFVAAERVGGLEAADRLYLALGDAIHGQQVDPLEDGVLSGALAAAKLPADLFTTALADPATTRAYLDSHEEGLRLGAFGVPTLRLDGGGRAFYGPIVDPVPTGGQALELWDYTRWVLERPYLWELKRERTYQPGAQRAI